MFSKVYQIPARESSFTDHRSYQNTTPRILRSISHRQQLYLLLAPRLWEYSTWKLCLSLPVRAAFRVFHIPRPHCVPSRTEVSRICQTHDVDKPGYLRCCAVPFKFRHPSEIPRETILFDFQDVQIKFQVWHMIFLQGVVFGIAAGAMYAPVLIWISDWFVSRRGLAAGVIFGGAGLGGFAFPLVMGYLLKGVGFRWTLRFDILRPFFLSFFLTCIQHKNLGIGIRGHLRTCYTRN